MRTVQRRITKEKDFPLTQVGDIVEIKDKNRMVCGVTLSSTGNQIHVLTPEGRDFKLSSEKVFFANPGLDVGKGKEFLSSNLREINAKRESIKNAIQLRLLWDIVHDQEQARTPEALAGIYFGGECGPHEIAAMIRALYTDFGYFRPRGNGFFPVDEKTVQAMEQGRKQQEIYKLWEDKFVSWLSQGGLTLPPEGSEKALEMLKDYLIFGDQPARSHTGKEFLRKAKINDLEILFKILVNAGLIQKDENLLLTKYHVPREFSPQLEAAALEVIRNWAVTGERLDLSDLETISIDDPSTTDIDDALSIEFSAEGCRIGIHIADASEFVPKDSLLDKEAHTRSTSIYLPDEKILMLPLPITEASSLKQEELRPAISILLNFHPNGQMTSWELKETLVKVKERLTYDEVDHRIDQDEKLSKLYQMALQFQEERKKAGAVIVQFPKIEVSVNKTTGEISVFKAKPRTASQVLVSEWMIRANHLVANYCVQSAVPTVYRTQAPPAKILPLSPDDWVTLFKQRRFLRRGEASVDPSPHHGLGLPVYLQMTSPLRRYTDLVVHRQIKANLRRQPLPYSKEDLEAILAYSERWVEISDLVEREWKKYWLLKLLETKTGSQFQAIVLEESNLSDHLLFIPDFSLEISCPKTTTKSLVEGDPVEVTLELVKPRLGLVKVIPC